MLKKLKNIYIYYIQYTVYINQAPLKDFMTKNTVNSSDFVVFKLTQLSMN